MKPTLVTSFPQSLSSVSPWWPHRKEDDNDCNQLYDSFRSGWTAQRQQFSWHTLLKKLLQSSFFLTYLKKITTKTLHTLGIFFSFRGNIKVNCIIWRVLQICVWNYLWPTHCPHTTLTSIESYLDWNNRDREVSLMYNNYPLRK